MCRGDRNSPSIEPIVIYINDKVHRSRNPEVIVGATMMGDFCKKAMTKNNNRNKLTVAIAISIIAGLVVAFSFVGYSLVVTTYDHDIRVKTNSTTAPTLGAWQPTNFKSLGSSSSSTPTSLVSYFSSFLNNSTNNAFFSSEGPSSSTEQPLHTNISNNNNHQAAEVTTQASTDMNESLKPEDDKMEVLLEISDGTLFKVQLSPGKELEITGTSRDAVSIREMQVRGQNPHSSYFSSRVGANSKSRTFQF